MHSTCNDNDSARCITFSAFSSSAFFRLFSSSSFSFFFLLSSSSFSFFFLFSSSSFSFFFLFSSPSLLLLLCFVLFLLGLFRLTLDSLCRLCQQLLVGSLLGKDLSRRVGGLSGVGGGDGWW